jgi:hypothetical protein
VIRRPDIVTRLYRQLRDGHPDARPHAEALAHGLLHMLQATTVDELDEAYAATCCVKDSWRK